MLTGDSARLRVGRQPDAYDSAIVVSSDSDLATPITTARQELAKTVGVLLPQRLSNPPQKTQRRSARLQQVASFFRDGIRTGLLAPSQFPPTLTDTRGVRASLGEFKKLRPVSLTPRFIGVLGVACVS